VRRSPLGQAVCLMTLLLAPGALAAPAPPSALRAGDATSSLGEMRFHARAVPFRHTATEARGEFSIQIPYREIKFLPKADSLFEGRLRVTVEVWNPAGKRVAYRQQEAQVQVTALDAGSDSLLGEIYTLGVTLKPGKYRYRLLVEDMNVARMGLVYKMKNQKRQGKVEGDLDVGPWLFANPALSGIAPAWEITNATESAAFRKGPYEVYPHPSGYYGLSKDILSAYYEIYDEAPPPGGRGYRIHSLVLGAEGDTVLTGVDSVRVREGGAWPHAIMVDVSTFTAGHYRLVLHVEREGERVAASSATEFDILWVEDSWLADASDFYEVTAGVLLSADEANHFPELSLGAKEVRIERAWREADPSPETAENEARNEFRRRVAYANARYTIFSRGMFTDRGRVYIRFGEPDETKIERLPVNDRTLSHALGTSIPQQSKETLTKTGSGVADFRPYEIWTYDMRGKQITPRYGLNELNSGMKFVFVDEQGYGEYTLRYSSTSGIH
jgi:GWxTD domain-containing protein